MMGHITATQNIHVCNVRRLAKRVRYARAPLNTDAHTKTLVAPHVEHEHSIPHPRARYQLNSKRTLYYGLCGHEYYVCAVDVYIIIPVCVMTVSVCLSVPLNRPWCSM